MKFFTLLVCALILGLAGCATQQPSTLGKTEMKQCKLSCVMQFDACKKKCHNNCRACSASSKNSSLLNYTKYVHEQQIEGGIIWRGLKSYRDPLQCRKISCNCSADLNTCNQGCTGVIQKRLHAVPYCA